MNPPRWSLVLPVILLCAPVAAPRAHASFHLMQVEQVVGGVNGDVSVQAIQLRIRSLGQNLVSQARVKAWDAAGLNPVLIVDMTTNVANGQAGDQVLIVSSTFQNYVSPVQAPDFTMTNLIPASYLTAGSLTFEDDLGTIYWRLSWGGAGYTGPGNMSAFNDANGNGNPPFAGPLPSSNLQAVRFNGLASALSTTNAADYALTAGASVWTNNARLSETLVGLPVAVYPGLDLFTTPGDGGVRLGAPSPNPATGALSYAVSLERASHVRVEVYSLSGRLVGTLVDRELPAGLHRFAWNARLDGDASLASGVYYLRLVADGARRTRTFTMIR